MKPSEAVSRQRQNVDRTKSAGAGDWKRRKRQNVDRTKSAGAEDWKRRKRQNVNRTKSAGASDRARSIKKPLLKLGSDAKRKL